MAKNAEEGGPQRGVRWPPSYDVWIWDLRSIRSRIRHIVRKTTEEGKPILGCPIRATQPFATASRCSTRGCTRTPS